MANVESFHLDHTKVKAPYVRLAGIKRTNHADAISKYDLRLLQPNQGALAPATLHTLEHLLAGYIRDQLPDVLDISPMGCRTGFYLTVVAEPDVKRVKLAFEAALGDVLAHQGAVPAASERECGNYQDHDLEQAKVCAQHVLSAGLHVQETVLIDGA